MRPRTPARGAGRRAGEPARKRDRASEALKLEVPERRAPVGELDGLVAVARAARGDAGRFRSQRTAARKGDVERRAGARGIDYGAEGSPLRVRHRRGAGPETIGRSADAGLDDQRLVADEPSGRCEHDRRSMYVPGVAGARNAIVAPRRCASVSTAPGPISIDQRTLRAR